MSERIKIKYWWSADRQWFCILTDDGNAQSTVSLTPEEAALLSGAAEPPITNLDLAWEKVNALGGYVGPDDAVGQAAKVIVNNALEIIEQLGGSDPLRKRAPANSLTQEDRP